jgi:hypothetical protein
MRQKSERALVKRHGRQSLFLILLLGLFAAAQQERAFAQAGSIGGVVGKRDKSISGGAEEDAPRPAPHPRPQHSVATQSPTSGPCDAIVGKWLWYRSLSTMTFIKDGTFRSNFGVAANWTCAGTRSARSDSNGVKEEYKISQDGKSMHVDSTWGGGVTFTATRLNGNQ